MDYGFLTRFAVTYDCNAYGAGTYDNNETCTTAGTTTTVGSSNLAATGINIAIGIGVGIALILVGVRLIMKLRRNNKSQKSQR